MPDTAARRSGPGSVVVVDTGEARCAMAWTSKAGQSGQYWFTDMFTGFVGGVGGVNDHNPPRGKETQTLDNTIKRSLHSNIGNLDHLQSVAIVVWLEGTLQRLDEGRGAGADGAANGETGAEKGCRRVRRNVAIDSRDEDDPSGCCHDRRCRVDFLLRVGGRRGGRAETSTAAEPEGRDTTGKESSWPGLRSGDHSKWTSRLQITILCELLALPAPNPSKNDNPLDFNSPSSPQQPPLSFHQHPS